MKKSTREKGIVVGRMCKRNLEGERGWRDIAEVNKTAVYNPLLLYVHGS